MSDDENQGADQKALTQSELAAQATEQRERDAAAWAERECDLARQYAADNQDEGAQPHGLVRNFGPPLPPLQFGNAAQHPVAAPPPRFATTDTMAALAAASQAMAAIAESPGNRSANNNSRGRDGDIVLCKDIPKVFDEASLYQ